MGDPQSGPKPGQADLRSVPAQPGPAESGRSGNPQPGGAARILVVDDQPELVRALAINLRARQYEVLTARAGQEALAVAASHPPDAVIPTWGCPASTGPR